MVYFRLADSADSLAAELHHPLLDFLGHCPGVLLCRFKTSVTAEFAVRDVSEMAERAEAHLTRSDCRNTDENAPEDFAGTSESIAVTLESSRR